MSGATARQSVETAYRVAAMPWEYDASDIRLLFQRGYDAFPDTKRGAALLVHDVEQFADLAFEYSGDDTPAIDGPGVLAVLATLAVECIRGHDDLAGIPLDHLVPVEQVRTLYVDTLLAMRRDRADDHAAFVREIAEFVLGRDLPDEMASEQVCPEVCRMPHLGDGWFVELPPTVARRTPVCGAPGASSENYWQEQGREATDENDPAYVAESDLKDYYREAFETAFQRLASAQHASLTDDRREWLCQTEVEISEHIDTLLRRGHTHRIWTDWSRDDRRLQAILNAVEAAPDDVACLGDSQSASALADAISTYYDPDSGWERVVLDDIDSARSVGNLLSDCEANPRVEIDRDGRTNRYRLQR